MTPLGKRLLVLLVALTAGLVALTALPAQAPAGAAAVTREARAVTPRIRISRVIGHSVRGRAIHAYYRGARHPSSVLVLLGQMHGDEHAGVRTARWVHDHVMPRSGTGIWVVPTMNPDGNARNTRKNARGVDLNRNWPTSGWRRGSRGDRYYGGPRKASEPETRAMMRFLSDVKPQYVASIHQPLFAIGRGGGHPRWLQRLHRNLGLPVRALGVGNPAGTVSPTMTGWYNLHYGGKHRVATTIEYGAHPGTRYVTVRAGRGIPRAARVY